MNRFEYEANYLKAGLEQFKAFLLSPEIFWNLSLSRPAGHPPYPQLSLGNMLLAAHIISSDSALKKRDELLEEFHAFQLEWAHAWEEKAEQEYQYRLRQWSRYIDDLQGAKAQSAGSFKNDIRVRVLLELLQSQLKDEGRQAIDELNALDLRFHQLMKAADFVWPLEIKGAFATEDYWFLYRSAK